MRATLALSTNYFMRLHYAFVILCFTVLLACKKEPAPKPVEPVPAKHGLLKDITVPNLPSPYYHFEYNTDSLVTKAAFSSGFTMYDVLYSGNKIAEMRNNTSTNRDTLRYSYDQAGKVTLIKFIDRTNVVYRRVFFTYNGNLIKEIEWEHKQADGSFLNDRTLTFSFYADGNVKTITDHRPSGSSPESVSVKTFEQYDDKINVDDFSLIHDGINDHLFLPQGFHLQKNNPKKEKLSANGTDLYTIDYTYTYNADKTPSHKTGSLLYLSGQNAGQRFQTNSFYTYY
jgi:hypothetical protein